MFFQSDFTEETASKHCPVMPNAEESECVSLDKETPSPSPDNLDIF